jgi:hypothetical protein
MINTFGRAALTDTLASAATVPRADSVLDLLPQANAMAAHASDPKGRLINRSISDLSL